MMTPAKREALIKGLVQAQNNVVAREVLLERARKERTKKVMAARAAGLTHKDMALATGLSRDRVNQIVMAASTATEKES